MRVNIAFTKSNHIFVSFFFPLAHSLVFLIKGTGFYFLAPRLAHFGPTMSLKLALHHPCWLLVRFGRCKALAEGERAGRERDFFLDQSHPHLCLSS